MFAEVVDTLHLAPNHVMGSLGIVSFLIHKCGFRTHFGMVTPFISTTCN